MFRKLKRTKVEHILHLKSGTDEGFYSFMVKGQNCGQAPWPGHCQGSVHGGREDTTHTGATMSLSLWFPCGAAPELHVPGQTGFAHVTAFSAFFSVLSDYSACRPPMSLGTRWACTGAQDR